MPRKANTMAIHNHIEFRDSNPASPGHLTRHVYIDGTELMIAEDGIQVSQPGNDEIQTVTLTIIPHRISFK